MISFVVFCFAAALAFGIPRLATKLGREQRDDGPRLEGVVFVASVLLAASFGWLIYAFLRAGEPLPVDAQRLLETATVGATRRGIEWHGLLLSLLTGLLYAASAWRGAKRLPPILADIFVVAAACALIYSGATHVASVRLPFSNAQIALGALAIPLTVGWIWLMARMTAALNRTPQVTVGFLGIVALAFLLILKFGGNTQLQSYFPPSLACAALAGAGLASVPRALKRSDWNIGWSAALAMGFWLAQVAVAGLFQSMAFAIIVLLLLIFGLPLLDIVFYRWGAARRDGESGLRLHEALMQRGLGPAKIAALYLAMTAALCALGVFLVATATWNLALRLALLVSIGFIGAIFFFSIIRVLMRRAPGEEIPENIEAFGVRISPVSMESAMDKIEEMIRVRTPHHVVTSDANAILRAHEDEEYAAIIRRAALITPDGYGVMWGARLLNLPIYERVTGVDMVNGICERAARNGHSIYILGSAPGVAATAAQKLAEAHPGLRIAGTQHGFFSQDGISEDEIAQQICDAKPDVLFVAFGIPKQEKFIAQHMAAMNVPVSLGVGGSFDVYSENLKRAPEWVQRSGMEWLYRVYQEPWRWKRMSYVPRFMIFALREWIFGSSREGRKEESV